MKKIILAGVLAFGVVSAQSYNPTVHWGDLLGFRFFLKIGEIQFDGVQIAFPSNSRAVMHLTQPRPPT
jgi:hypothetical protein